MPSHKDVSLGLRLFKLGPTCKLCLIILPGASRPLLDHILTTQGLLNKNLHNFSFLWSQREFYIPTERYWSILSNYAQYSMFWLDILGLICNQIQGIFMDSCLHLLASYLVLQSFRDFFFNTLHLFKGFSKASHVGLLVINVLWPQELQSSLVELQHLASSMTLLCYGIYAWAYELFLINT